MMRHGGIREATRWHTWGEMLTLCDGNVTLRESQDCWRDGYINDGQMVVMTDGEMVVTTD
jgi:hypothetical protein